MKIEIAEHGRMTERGSSLLRLIQNNDMPTLDLLVRESVQNSLDAARPGTGFVNVEFEVKEFNSLELNCCLEGAEINLNKKFPAGKYKLLEIKDSNTTGLTGPLHYKDVKDNEFGNLLKLIYEISMPQQQEGAGGSWGLGKTVYFRIGIGLVFYYTRIEKPNGRYATRLAVCLVEDERKADAIIKSVDEKPKRGIAWWGQGAGENTTMPLTDDKEIEKILKIFNTVPYKGSETGTTIVIPYIDESILLHGTSPEVESNIKPWWTNSVGDYLKVAVQRWYAPRIMNNRYKNGRWLRVKVNGEGIEADEMLPVFRVIQALYNRTKLADESSSKKDILSGLDFHVETISLRSTFTSDGCAGYISYVKLTEEDLLMKWPINNPDPYIQINKYNEDGDFNSPIIMYVRKPGMIVGYETSGNWTEGIPKTIQNEFVIGLFVANSNNTLKLSCGNMMMDEYIRKSEKADHTSWIDWNYGAQKSTIIARIQKQIKKYISSTYCEKETNNPSKRNMSLGRVLAEILLPPEGFGSKASYKTSSNKSSVSSSSSRGFGLKVVGNPEYSDGKIKVKFKLNCGKKSDKLQIQLQVLSESGGIAADKWENDEGIGKQFPIKFQEMEINKINTSKKGAGLKAKDFRLYDGSEEIEYENIIIERIKTNKYKVPYGVIIKLPEATGYRLSGSISFSSNVDKIQGSLVAFQDEDDE